MSNDLLITHFGLILVAGLFGILSITWIAMGIFLDVRQAIRNRKNGPPKPLPTQKVHEVAGVLLALGIIVPIGVAIALLGLAEGWW
jgi:hypothetical protein